MSSFKKFLFYFIQWTWGLPVNAVGGLAFLICKMRGNRTEKFENAYITYLNWNAGGLSLGLFLFIKDDFWNRSWIYDTRIHEYGHTWQCLVLGPFYWPVIGLPSAIWYHGFEGYRRRKNISYYAFYPEKWANYCGQRATGMKMRCGLDTNSRTSV